MLSADNVVTADMGSAERTAWFSVLGEPRGNAAWLDAQGLLRLRIQELRLDETVCHRRDLQLMGDHNILNVLAACAISAISGAVLEPMRAVATTFRGVEHRLQLVRELDGVRYYDGSIATTPERLMADLRCFDRPVVLLCGGRDKHLPWEDAVRLMAQRCRHVALFGEMAPLVKAEIDRQQANVGVTPCDGLDQAVKAAASIAQPGDVVLLSPGGTSYDAYKDFAERGDVFVRLVDELHSTMALGEVTQ